MTIDMDYECLDDILKQLQTYSKLQQGWDGYSAPPPSELAIANANKFLNMSYVAKLKPTRVKPSVIGGIGIVFRNNARKIYIEFINSGFAHILYQDGATDPTLSIIEEYQTVLNNIREYLY